MNLLVSFRFLLGLLFFDFDGDGLIVDFVIVVFLDGLVVDKMILVGNYGLSLMIKPLTCQADQREQCSG